MLDTLLYYLSFPFVQYALIVGTLIALCASLLGTTLILKGFSYMGNGLSHVAFGTTVVATVLHINNEMLLVMPITVMVAIALLRGSKNVQIRGDVKVAMLSVGSLAVGYLIITLFSKSANVSADVCRTLFGSTSILTLSTGDVVVAILASALVIVLFLVFYHKIFAMTFDKDFAKVIGVNVQGYELLIAIIIAVIIVLSMNLVGSLLITALIIFPAITSMGLFRSYKGVIISSAIIAVLAALIGMVVSILISAPVGSTIVVVNILIYFVCRIPFMLRGEAR